MIIDAHLHITEKDLDNNILKVMEKENIFGLAAGTNPENCQWVKYLAKQSRQILPTYGLHPWYADQYTIKDMKSYLYECAIIGEIGMDSVWCDVDLSCQRKAFVAQLEIAEERGCPVILHTKGQEREISKIIADYTVPVIVHWYSSPDNPDPYLDRDCYFTVGPDVQINPAVQRIIREAPLNRLFVESDGISAVEWATGKIITPADLPGMLRNSMSYISKIKNIDFALVESEMEKSLHNLIDFGGKGNK